MDQQTKAALRAMLEVIQLLASVVLRGAALGTPLDQQNRVLVERAGIEAALLEVRQRIQD